MKITKKQALEFKKRWKIVNKVQLKELRKSSVVEKLNQLTVLMSWAKDFGWINTLKAEELAVRERWIKLRRIYHV